MKNRLCSIGILIIVQACNTISQEKDSEKLAPLSELKGKPRMGEWLSEHTEPYLSLQDYISRKPLQTDTVRQYLYLVKLGDFDSTANVIFEMTREYLASFFLIATRELAPLNANSIPLTQRRANGQISAGYVLDSILVKRLPPDAHSIIAFTPIDLYPKDDWNYAFGLASLQQRVGVWSMARFIQKDGDQPDIGLALRRTLHVAAHETGHMFGLPHCAVFACCMNGSNSLNELDGQVAWLCHNCVAKLCWNRRACVWAHSMSMKTFYEKYFHNSVEEQHYQMACELLQP